MWDVGPDQRAHGQCDEHQPDDESGELEGARASEQATQRQIQQR
jgi:hypothetical protein